MRTHIKLGRIFGVDIGLHYSWLIIAVLIAVSLASNFQEYHPNWAPQTVWAAAILTALLFFATLIAHELSHALVAKSRGLPVRSITLFALGGVAQIEREASDAKSEFWMAIVGPIASAVIGGACLLLAWLAGCHNFSVPETPRLAILVWLGFINLILAGFNMIPGFPLDGGRVLHAIIWWIGKNAERSMRIATQVGRVVAVLFILFGVLRFFNGAGIGGLWIAFIGWFLWEAAGSSYAQVRLTQVLRGVRVRDLMVRDCPAVDMHANLNQFVQEQMVRSAHPCYLVMDNGRVAGLLTPREVKSVPQPQWPYRTAADVMRPLDEFRTIAPDKPVTEALETMGRENLNQLPVASDGHIEGVISRSSVLGFLETRAQLKM